MKFDNTLMLCVSRDIECGRVPMLLGEPGIGKSSWAEDLARQMRTQIFVLPCNQLADKTDLTGARLIPTDEGGYKQVFYPHAVIADAITYARENPRETPILFLDEINRTNSDVTSAALSIPTLRAIGSEQLPDNLRVICAGNDKGNITSLDEASISRFALYRTVPDVATFIAVNPELNIHIKRVLENKPETIFCKQLMDTSGTDDDGNDLFVEDMFEDDDGMLQITTPRTISGLSMWLNQFDDQELLQLLSESEMVDGEPQPILQSAIYGHVGDTMFARLLLDELGTYLTSQAGNNGASNIAAKVTKPKCFDDLRALTTMSDLNQAIADLTDKDRSGCLVYAMHQKQDNSHMLRALASATTKLETDDFKTLLMLSANDELDAGNVQVFLETGTPVAVQLSTVLDYS